MARPKPAKQSKSPAKVGDSNPSMREKKPHGRPTKRTPEVERAILEGLSKGTPLTIICQPESMPHDNTVREWANADAEFSGAIARAREAGFDAIALEILAIADNIGHEGRDTILTDFGSIPNKEWILRSKLRCEMRLKLLAKWDPKRYGEKFIQELTGLDGGAIQVEDRSRSKEEMAEFAAMVAAADKKARPHAPGASA